MQSSACTDLRALVKAGFKTADFYYREHTNQRNKRATYEISTASATDTFPRIIRVRLECG